MGWSSPIYAIYLLYFLYIYHICITFTIYLLYINYIYYIFTICLLYLLQARPRPRLAQARPTPGPTLCLQEAFLIFFTFAYFFTFWAFSQRPSLRYGARARIWGQGQAQAYVCRRQSLFCLLLLYFSLLLARSKKNKLK